jgi:pimeloyl-ACP methyl ester carboxylesterase
VELAAAIRAPHVVVHGKGDRFIHWSEAVTLHEAAAHPSRLVLVDDMGHAFMPASRAVITRSVAWVLAHERSPHALTVPPPGEG